MFEFRQLYPEDFAAITAVVDDWWGRPIRALLPRYFFDHFGNTSFVAEAEGQLAGFVIGFLSPARRDDAYIHFVGVDPRWRGRGLASELYARFSALARADGRTVLRAITSPDNEGSLEFHRRLGFMFEPAAAGTGAVPVHESYGPNGEARVLMVKAI